MFHGNDERIKWILTHNNVVFDEAPWCTGRDDFIFEQKIPTPTHANFQNLTKLESNSSTANSDIQVAGSLLKTPQRKPVGSLLPGKRGGGGSGPEY
jgi:hypothetical protein